VSHELFVWGWPGNETHPTSTSQVARMGTNHQHLADSMLPTRGLLLDPAQLLAASYWTQESFCWDSHILFSSKMLKFIELDTGICQWWPPNAQQENSDYEGLSVEEGSWCADSQLVWIQWYILRQQVSQCAFITYK
jgi:hypothetical protein